MDEVSCHVLTLELGKIPEQPVFFHFLSVECVSYHMLPCLHKVGLFIHHDSFITTCLWLDFCLVFVCRGNVKRSSAEVYC